MTFICMSIITYIGVCTQLFLFTWLLVDVHSLASGQWL